MNYVKKFFAKKESKIFIVIIFLLVLGFLASFSGSLFTEINAGKDGEDGRDGANGKSAYELAVQKGYSGSLTEWLATLEGDDGADGQSAYQLAVTKGYTGTEDEWLESLRASVADGSLDESKLSASLALKIVKEYVTPQMFGAKGDGITDDTLAIQSMLDAVENGSTVVFPKGIYNIDPWKIKKDGAYGYGGLLLRHKTDITVFLQDGAILQSIANDNNAMDIGPSALFCIDRCENVIFLGGELVGELSKHVFPDDYDPAVSRIVNQMGLLVRSSKNVVIDGVESHSFLAACICVGGNPKSDGVEIRNCLAYESHYHPIVIEGADNVELFNTTAYGTYENKNYGCAIDIEGIDVNNFNKNIVIDNCFFGETEKNSLGIHKCENVTISNTKIEKSPFVIQMARDVFINDCIIEDTYAGVLNGNAENVVFDGCKFINSNARLEITSAYQNNLLENIVFKNNVFSFTNSFDEFPKGFSFFDMRPGGRASVIILDNIFECVSGHVQILKIESKLGEHKSVIRGNKFVIGSPENKISKLQRDLITFTNSKIEFCDNVFDIYFDETFIANQNNSDVAKLNLFMIRHDGEHMISINDNVFNIYGNASVECNFISFYQENGDIVPTKFAYEFVGNKIYCELENFKKIVPVSNYKFFVCNNIIMSFLPSLIDESLETVTANNNVYYILE